MILEDTKISTAPQVLQSWSAVEPPKVATLKNLDSSTSGKP